MILVGTQAGLFRFSNDDGGWRNHGAALEEIGAKGISSVMFSIDKDIDMMYGMASEVMPRFQ